MVEKLDFADPNCKIVNNVYATFWGANKVYYGKCGISESRHLKKNLGLWGQKGMRTSGKVLATPLLLLGMRVTPHACQSLSV